MEDSVRIQVAQSLQDREGELADGWYVAVALTSHPRLSAAQVKQQLATLAQQLIVLLGAERFDASGAEEVGTALSRLYHARPDVLGRSQVFLARELPRGIGPQHLFEAQPWVAALMEGMATGYLQESARIILEDQESIRRALVDELRAAERQLRAAHDHLEEQVTQRTAELRAREEQWRALVDGAPDLVRVIDSETRLLYANRTGAGTLATVSQLMGQPLLGYVQPDQRPAVKDAIDRVFTLGTEVSFELAHRTPDGAMIWYSVRMVPVGGDGGEATALAVLRDITDRKKREETIEGYVRDAAHELRSPLAKAHMSLELLLERVEREPIDHQELVRFGTIALRNVQELVHTVDRVLDLARLEAGAGAYRKELLHPAELVQAAIASVEPLASAKGLSLVAVVAPTIGGIEVDSRRMEQVLHNLLDNAIKFTTRGEICVEVRENQEEVEFRIRDTGCGILPENLKRVFDRFFQERTNVPGVGVGLSICKVIVEAHGGKIWAESGGRDAGTTMHLTVPVAGEASE